MSGRILAIDPGEKRIGIAISDPTGTIARTLGVLKHTSMMVDVEEILKFSLENVVVKIVIGESKGEDGSETSQSRHAKKLADCIHNHSSYPVELWDEYGSTRVARETRLKMGVKKNKRNGHLDDLAAVIILQSFLNDQIEKSGRNV
ncbi:MAG: Holliday junction resolvase RuvX [Chloroflexi bacterium]|nr:Holliday junction resolvase RuvX [Chloroflexota bacterium]